MMRWILAVAVAVCLLRPAGAAPAGTNEDPKTSPPAQKAPVQVAKEKQDPTKADRFKLGHETEVLLDGRPCSYDAVPDSAVIVNMAITRDQRIVRIHFRSRR